MSGRNVNRILKELAPALMSGEERSRGQDKEHFALDFRTAQYTRSVLKSKALSFLLSSLELAFLGGCATNNVPTVCQSPVPRLDRHQGHFTVLASNDHRSANADFRPLDWIESVLRDNSASNPLLLVAYRRDDHMGSGSRYWGPGGAGENVAELYGV